MTVLECPHASIILFEFSYFILYIIILIIPIDVNVLPVPGGPLIKLIGYA